MSLCEVPEDSLWAGKQLAELDFRKHFGVNVSSILRGRSASTSPMARWPSSPATSSR